MLKITWLMKEVKEKKKLLSYAVPLLCWVVNDAF